MYDGLLWSVYEWVTLVYGSYEQVVTIENGDLSTKLIIIFIIELGILVILASGNFIRGCHVFWRLLVTIEKW